eukprot:Skav220516  [mRNA]  locus=scaffold279:224427:225293:+ [translate_table: standard]
MKKTWKLEGKEMNKEAREKLRKERAKQKQMEVKEEKRIIRETPFTLNLNINGENKTVVITPDMTTAEVRDEIVKNHFPSMKRKHKKQMMMYVNDTCLNDHPRRTAGGHKLNSESIVRIAFGGAGGGKRGSSSVGVKTKEELNTTVMEEIDILAMRIQTVGSGSPHIETSMKKIMDIKTGINSKQNVFPMLLGIIDDGTVGQLMTEVLPSSSKPLERSKKIASIIFNQDLKNLEELRTQRAKVVEALGNAIHMAVISEYGDKYCNISWEAFSQDLVKRSKETKTETTSE